MVKRFTRVKRWLRCNFLQATLLLALFINAIALSPAFSSILKIGKKRFFNSNFLASVKVFFADLSTEKSRLFLICGQRNGSK
jgi:hypothetical protein